MVLEKILESPLYCKEIKSVNPKGNQLWIFIGRTDAEDEAPILWQPDVNNQLIGKDPDAGKDWKQEEKGMTEDKMAGWHHQLNGHEFEQASGDGEGQGNQCAAVPGVTKSSTWLSNWSTTKKTLESPWDCKEIKSVNPKGNQPWIVIGRADAKGEAPMLWHVMKSLLIGKDSDAWKDWRQKEKGTSEADMVR